MSTPEELTLDNCGCCEPEPEPSLIYNRPGLPALSYRAGTYSTFLRRMFNRLDTYTLPDGNHFGERPLVALSTRELDDPSLALLDVSAVVADVLTFYQERIANEGFLRTAIERLSILELARAIGYELRPGVAAGTYLAFNIEDAPGAPTSAEIPIGSKVQSVPPQDKLPQTFETTEAITAHREWNAIRPRMTSPQHIAIEDNPDQLTLNGVSANLKAGDRLLIVQTMNNGALALLVHVHKVSVDQDNKRTTVDLAANVSTTVSSASTLPSGTVDITTKIPFSGSAAEQQIIGRSWDNDDLNTFLTINEWDPDKLLAFLAEYRTLHPDVKGEVYALRTSVAFFGSNAPRRATLPNKVGTQTLNYGKNWDSGWEIWKNQISGGYYTDAVDADGNTVDVYLERTLQGVVPASWMAIENLSGKQAAYRVHTTVERSLAAFAMSGKVTGLSLKDHNNQFFSNDKKSADYKVRNSVAYLQSEQLTLAEAMRDDALVKGADTLDLDGLVLGLAVGQTVILNGERADTEGVMASEALVIKTIMHKGGYTSLTFEQGFENDYKRKTATINANVAHATHGETTSEILGSGSGAQANQRFTLRKPPLTYTSASTTSGAENTLQVRINDLLWTESSSLYPLGPNDKQYVVRTGADGKATVIFGDGKHGARLPTGTNNIVATYRSGIGLDGEVKAGTLTMLASKPLGLKSATNPIAASGAADAEVLDNARTNAPLTVRTLDRIVSLADYEDFARAFAGVGKAQAIDLWSGEMHLVHVTIAGADGDPIDDDSDLFMNLVAGINKVRDPAQIVNVDSFQRLLFNLRANVAVNSPSYIKEKVFSAIEDALQEAFAFEKRAFGQMVTSAEVITIIQQVEGVIAVDLDYLYLSSNSAEFKTLLPAQIARVNTVGKILQTQLLLINPIGVTLAEMKP